MAQQVDLGSRLFLTILRLGTTKTLVYLANLRFTGAPISTALLPWSEIDTVLLDMDGTLLDLHYDNHLWNTLLPAKYAQTHNLNEAAAREHLFSYMQGVRGTLEFYCLDHWADFTQLDMHALHKARTDLVQYRPGAHEFLTALQRSPITTALVTNAHRMSLEVKDQVSNICALVDHVISCHDYGAPKEDQAFWHSLQTKHPFDPQRTLFIDDNHDVLASAAKFGIQHLRTIKYPDSQREAKPTGAYLAAENLASLYDPILSKGKGP